MANIYGVLYQLRKPAAAPSTVGQIAQGNSYSKEIRNAVVLANDNGPDVVRVIKANATIASGEVVDLIRVQQIHASAIDGVWS